jgi:hypothetical protein
MNRKENGADKYEQVPQSDRQAFPDAQEVQTDECQQHPCPDKRTTLFLEKQSDQRNDDDI